MSIDVFFAIKLKKLCLCKISETYKFGLFLLNTVHDNKGVTGRCTVIFLTSFETNGNFCFET